MELELPINDKGHPSSALVQTLAGRRLGLAGAKPGGAHPVQLLHSAWRTFSSSLLVFANELEAVEFGTKPDGERVSDAFRRLTYDATEVFDIYTHLLVERLGPFPASDRHSLKDYQTAAKRLRERWAMICNKCKHSGAQMTYLRAVSQVDGRPSSRFMVQSYKNADSLVRDDEVHKGQHGGAGLVVSAQELLHGLLRVDLQAAKFVGLIPDRECEPLPLLSAELPIGEGLTKLLKFRATVYPDESTRFDGLRIEGQKVLLERSSADKLAAPLRVTLALPGDGVTKSFSIF